MINDILNGNCIKNKEINEINWKRKNNSFWKNKIKFAKYLKNADINNVKDAILLIQTSIKIWFKKSITSNKFIYIFIYFFNLKMYEYKL